MSRVSGNLKTDKLILQGHGDIINKDVSMYVTQDTFNLSMGGDTLLMVAPDGIDTINDSSTSTSDMLTITKNTTIDGDLLVTGTISGTMKSPHDLDPDFVDRWSGVWQSKNLAFILELQEDQTYKHYAIKNRQDWRTGLRLAASGITVSKETDYKKIIVGGEEYVKYFEGETETEYALTSDVTSYTVQGPFVARREMKPDDFPFQTNWVSSMQALMTEEVMKSKLRLGLFKDLKSTWERLKTNLLESNTGNNYLELFPTGKTIRVNRHQKSSLELTNLSEQLGYTATNTQYAISDLKYANNFKGDNIVEITYLPLTTNEFSKVNVASEVIVSGTNTALDGMKLMPSTMFNTNYQTGLRNSQSSYSGTFKIGLRVPLKISNVQTLSITNKGKTTSINVPAGNYYSHDLAESISELLEQNGSHIRVEFYAEPFLWTPTPKMEEHDYFYYITTGDDSAISVSGGAEIIAALGFGQLTAVAPTSTEQASSKRMSSSLGEAVSSDGGYSTEMKGSMPTHYTKGTKPIKLHTSLGQLSASSGFISVTSGPAVLSDDPRVFYSAVLDYTFQTRLDHHNRTKFNCLPDVDEEIYIPRSWKEYEYKIDAGMVPFRMIDLWGISGMPEINAGIGNLSKNYYYESYNSYFGWLLFKNMYRGGKSSISHLPLLGPTNSKKVVENKGYTYKNYLVTPKVVNIKKENDVETYFLDDLLNLPEDTETITYRCPNMGSCIGIFKAEVISKLMPGTQGNVGYIWFEAFYFKGDLDEYTKLVTEFFNTNNVKYAVVDVRENPGGSTDRRYLPIGDVNLRTRAQPIHYVEYGVMARNTQVGVSMVEMAKAVKENPDDFPTTYKDHFENVVNLDDPDDPTVIFPNEINVPFVSDCNFSYLVSKNSGSGTNSAITRYLRGNNYDGDMGANCKVTLIGELPSLFGTAGSNRGVGTDYDVEGILNDLVQTDYTRQESRNYLRDGQEIDDVFGPWYKLDAITNADVESFKISVGITSDSRFTGINFNDSTTWRDFTLERAIQAAIAGSSVVRNTPGYGSLVKDVPAGHELPAQMF